MPFARQRAATAAKFSTATATSAAAAAEAAEAAAAVLVPAHARQGIYTEVVLSECERV